MGSLVEKVNNKCFLKIKSSNPNFRYTIIKPLGIIYKAGSYYIEGDDYLENKIVDFLIDGSNNQFIPVEVRFDQLPEFKAEGKT